MCDHSCADCVSPIFWVQALFASHDRHTSKGYAGCHPFDRGCGWCCGDNSLVWKLCRTSLMCGCHRPVRGGVCFPVVWVEALRVRFDKGLLLVCVFCPQEGEHECKWGLCAHREPVHWVIMQGSSVLPRNSPNAASLSPFCFYKT